MLEELELEIPDYLKETDGNGNTLLHLAIKSDNQVLAKQLVTAGCNVNAKNDSGDTALALAIQQNKLEMVKILLSSGAHYGNDFFKFKRGPLFMAAENGCPEIVQLFIELGADVNACCESQLSPLYFAAGCSNEKKSYDHCKIIKMLVDAGADVNGTDGNTPLIQAVVDGFTAGFELLLSLGSDIFIEGKMISILLDEAIWTSNFHILTRLVELGYDVNVIDNDGDSCLHLAALLSCGQMVEFLLNNGAEIKANKYGHDPLYFGLHGSWSDDYEDLSATSDDHDKEIEEGINSKLYANQMKIIELLIKHGANVNYEDADGLTPLYVVLEGFRYFHSGFVDILLKNGAKFDFEHPLVREVMNSSNGSNFPHLLLRHTAMFDVQNRMDGPKNFDVGKLNPDLLDDYTRCRAELELMKSTKINDTNVSFFNLLVDRDIGPYIRNRSITTAFKVSTVCKRFPIYSDLLCDRYIEELEFQSLVREATNGLSRLLSWDKNHTYLLLSNILRYLDEDDLITVSLI